MPEASFASRRPRCSASRRLPGKVGFSAHQRNGRHGGVCAWRLASWPPRCSPVLVNPATDGVKRLPSLLIITVGFPPSMTATTEFVVPRSMPTAFAIPHLTAFVSGLPHRVSQQLGITPPGVGDSYHLIQVETPGCQRRNRATAQAPRVFAFTHRPRFTYSKYRANFSRFGLQGY